MFICFSSYNYRSILFSRVSILRLLLKCVAHRKIVTKAGQRLFPETVYAFYMHNKFITFDYVFPAGFNPVWDEKFSFAVHWPEMALVRFLALSGKGTSNVIGQYTLPFDSVLQGLKSIGFVSACVIAHLT